jgi:hypothetical protein
MARRKRKRAADAAAGARASRPHQCRHIIISMY